MANVALPWTLGYVSMCLPLGVTKEAFKRLNINGCYVYKYDRVNG